MSTIQQRIQALDDEKLLGFIDDFEWFEKDAQIGDCSLRAEAEELGEEFKAPHNVVMWMHMIAFEAYRELYRRSRARIVGLEVELAAKRERREAAEAALAAERERREAAEAELAAERGRRGSAEAELAAERGRRGSAEWVLKEIRIRLHAAGRRPEECWEMSEIDGHLAQFGRHKD